MVYPHNLNYHYTQPSLNLIVMQDMLAYSRPNDEPCYFRFHCLHWEIRMHPERVCTVIAACIVLHNMCIAKRIPLPRQNHLPMPEEDDPVVPLGRFEDVSGRLVRAHIVDNL